MKKRNGFLIILCLLAVTTFQTSCDNDNSRKKANYGEKTLELIDIVEKNPDIKSMLITSISKAKKINP